MDAISLPTVTLPRAAHAAGFSTRALQALMGSTSRPVLLGQPIRAAQGRNRFAPVDVARLAVTRLLLEYGFTPAEARHALDWHVDRHFFALASCGADVPGFMLAQRLNGVAVSIVRPGTSGAVLVLDLGTIARDALDRLANPTPPLTRAGSPATNGATA